MVAFVKYEIGTEVLLEASNAASDTWQIALSNTAPNVATDTTLASATELGTAGGYTAGGVNATITSSSQTAGVYKLTLAAPVSPTWTASGGGFTFRYVLLYNLTQTQLIGYWDYGSSVVMTAGAIFTPILDTVGGAFTVT